MTDDHIDQPPLPEPPKKKRKKRKPLNCAECRRLKLKCDREVPCSNCKRRGCTSQCWGVDMDDHQNDDRHSFSSHYDKANTSNQTATLGVSQGETGVAREQISVSDGDRSSRFPEGPSEILPTFVPSATSVHFAASQPPASSLSPHSLPGSDRTAFQERSFGSLRIGRDGRSRYLGPTAASQWLRDQESAEDRGVPSLSRVSSPLANQSHASRFSLAVHRATTFPFDNSFSALTKESIIASMPSWSEANGLIEAYYRYFAFHFEIVSRSTLQQILQQAYSYVRNRTLGQSLKVHPQELALLFIVFAMGARYSLESTLDEAPDLEYLPLAQACLAKGDFMAHNTLAGVQALVIMAFYNLEAEDGRSGDSAWPLFGLAMRIIQAMGLHRDGQRWGLPDHIIEERRRIFWESYSADIFQANCFSRPNSIYPEYVDTAFPAERYIEDGLEPGEKGYFTLKYELSQLSVRIIDLTMRASAPDYIQIVDLHKALISFQRDIPYTFRCRAMLESLPSEYADPVNAREQSPQPSKRDLSKTFQRTLLAMMLTETNLYLHRPFFARAMLDTAADPTRSAYGLSYLTVVERCNAMVQLVAEIHALYPSVSARHWALWYHLFNAAVCMGNLVLHRPHDQLAGFAMIQLESTIGLYLKIVPLRSSPAVMRNLKWLWRLRARAAQAGTRGADTSTCDVESIEDADVDDANMLGWRTRLIERATETGGINLPTSAQISASRQAVPSNEPVTAVNETISKALEELFTSSSSSAHFRSPGTTSQSMDPAADLLFSQLCNLPMEPSDGTFGNTTDPSADLWEWDDGLEGVDLSAIDWGT
ncbi:hypothetical protein C361_02913 [Cryptococcus neoformans Tu259-1]|uniref:Zn(2)-C6 fungal-type domain-containing protein n=1 Tax=Cryptococcus neoformans Tu259-1 TaxID=1230072 RepID=A0A854QGG9_CRYNE|nr:hypothetical protein C353_02580 [Cryptococcus neoformans var. grubii AD1-83a]OXG23145.1 hypothetical protein C361_02913 [Cryptococcus neoformans var. grubii Tu259-1]OXG61983.1 hypothetical protein C354_02515 [Cryptococcus neoformans var. grubii MW-RSA1955]OXG65291.1 hypothetical protein C351_02303 [Cryptococcus neoformans var. grubii c8]OXG67127.1 hypothetical protein C352_02523 [Cryptococcus neoformans var. grubii CHC193]OXH13248.1 hypothetical protein C369_02561 [Cryptococcus neoformans v